MKKLFLIFLILPFLLGAAPVRQVDYEEGETITDTDVESNENAIFDYLQNGIDTIAIDVVNDTHIDWGTGTNQVSQDDVVDGSTYKQYNPASVAITGGSITGITDLAVADGGTGASTLSDGFVLLGNGTSAIQTLDVTGNGAIIIGDGTTDPVTLSAFTSSTGTLKHEYGGLEADVSGYTNGIYGQLAGATANIDTSSEVISAISDETGTGNLVFSASPTFTGTITAASINASGTTTGAVTDTQYIEYSTGAELIVRDNLSINGTLTATNLSGTNTGDQTITLTGDVTGSGTGSFATTIAADSVALTTDTSGNYVKDIADGTGIDGTASAEGATYTPTLDLTEINSTTFGSGTFTTLTFDAGVIDPIFTFGSNSLAITNCATLTTGGNTLYWAGGTDVAVADGGTGKSSWTQYLIPYADTTTSFGQIAIGTSGQVLTSNGAGAAPTFQAAASGGDTLDVITVGANGDYATIQGALDVAATGDTILVSEGTYTEAITFGDDTVTIKATGSKENTTITQAAAAVVNFSTYEGCVLEGFTVSVTAADGAADYPITGANDTANNTANIIRNCKIVGALTAANFHYYGIELTNGDWIFENCLFDFDETRTPSTYNFGSLHLNGCDNVTLRNCTMDVDSTNAGGGLLIGIYFSSATVCTLNIWDTKIEHNSALTTTGNTVDLYIGTGNHIINLYNVDMTAQTSSTGLSNCLWFVDNAPIVSSYNCIYKSTNTDNDGTWATIAAGSTLNSYNDSVLDGVLSNSGTYNPNMSPDNSTNLALKINANQAGVTASDTFIDFQSTTGSEGTIAGTAVAGVIAYNTFTGSHFTQIIDKTNLKINMLLEIVPEKIINWDYDKEVFIKKGSPILDLEGNPKKDVQGKILIEPKDRKEIRRIKSNASPKGQLFKSRICKTRQSKAAIGVYGGTNNEGQDLCLSIGTGFLIVANKGQNIEIGDLLISSDVEGCAEKQNSNIVHNYTIGKATETIIWKEGEATRTISVIYTGG